MGKRKTIEQMKWLKALVALLDLYDALKKSPSSNPSNAVIKKMSRLFNLTIANFSPALYFPQRRFFAYRIQPAATSLYATDLIVFDDLDNFLVLMDALESDLKKGIFTALIEIDVMHESFFDRMDSKSIEYFRPFDIIRGNEKLLKNYLCIAGGEIQKSPTREADRAVPESQDKPLKSRPWKDAIRELGVNVNEKDFYNPNYYETFDAYSYKGSSLATLLIGKDGNVATPGYPNPISRFTDVVRYILVKYMHLHGSLDRIKICKACGRLFPEKKYGFGIFCSDRCRLSHHIEKEPDHLRTCRGKQNALLRRAFNRPVSKDELKEEDKKRKRTEIPSYVRRYDCQDCKEQLASGDCLILNVKNPLLAAKRDPRKSKRSKSTVRSSRT